MLSKLGAPALVVLAVLTMMGISLAQADKPVTPNTEQQELIRTAAEAEAVAAKEVQLAQANHRAATARTLQAIYSVMAELKLSPKEYGWRVVEGKLVFEKLPEKKQ